MSKLSVLQASSATNRVSENSGTKHASNALSRHSLEKTSISPSLLIGDHLSNSSSKRLLVSSKEAARMINVAFQTLAQWRMNRKVNIPFVRIGRRVMYRHSDLAEFIAENRHHINDQIGGEL